MSLIDTLVNLFNEVRPFVPMYIHLILSALFPIYTGAHASLSRPPSAAKPAKKIEKAEDESEDEDKVQKMEGLSNTDAIVLPVTAGLVLTALYLIITKYGADLVNLIMGYYFACIGVVSVVKMVNDASNIVVGFVFPNYYRYRSSLSDKGCLMKVVGSERKAVQQNGGGEQIETALPVPNALTKFKLFRDRFWDLRQNLKQKYTVKAYMHTIVDLCLNFTLVNAFSAFVGLAAVTYGLMGSQPWWLINLQGFAVSYSALQLLSPTTFNTGSLILSALFLYDIWAVFFTPLMVTVAKNLDQPIKLVFPRPEEPSDTPGEPPVKSFSMLGLGDVVVPGIMIGLALRFDLYMYYLKKQRKSSKISIDSSTGEATTTEFVEKAPYVSVTGRWGDRFWISGLSDESLPPQLQSSFPKPYFTASMTGYVVGMITTLGVMSIFKHAQPALLYLVPGVLISLWTTALIKGDLREMIDFSEAITSEQLNEDEGKEKKEEVKEWADGNLSKGLFERLWQELWHDNDKKPTDDKEIETAKPKEDEKKSANSKKENNNDGVLFSFSIARYQPKSDATTKAKPEHSPVASEASEDTVLVTSADIVENQDSDAAPRYRTRRRKA